MRLTVLASGSAGNSVLVESDGTRVLVDAGLAPRVLAARMERGAVGRRLEDVTAVVLTHEHGDHASGAKALASADVPIWATDGTARALGLKAARPLAAGSRSRVGALEVLPVRVPHDAAEPVGLVLEGEGGRVGVLFDCGHPTVEVARAFAHCDVLVLEANHDAELLRAGAYPPAVKRRISGTQGHLSNEQAAMFLKLMGDGLPRVLVLAHLSALTNRPRLARQAIERVLASGPRRSRVLCATQDRPTPPITITAGVIELAAEDDHRQLRLAFPD